MPDIVERLKRAYDLSKIKDDRYKGAGFSVYENRGRCTSVLCEGLVEANTALGGKTPFPYGLMFLQADLSIVADPPADLQNVPLAEILPVDTEDPRAAKLTWNQSGTEATFSFASVANLFRIKPPDGTTLWFDATVLTDTDGLPVILVPLGQYIQTKATREREIAASRHPEDAQQI